MEIKTAKSEPGMWSAAEHPHDCEWTHGEASRQKNKDSHNESNTAQPSESRNKNANEDVDSHIPKSTEVQVGTYRSSLTYLPQRD
jgi:hypothetical protein